MAIALWLIAIVWFSLITLLDYDFIGNTVISAALRMAIENNSVLK
ncbi:hypothetical protein FLA_2716 [Filimonas lacunae]|nr:hypothetical protein FLA_2716 [Filimonas lacunae]